MGDSKTALPDCIIGFSFGMRKGSAGPVNSALGMVLKMYLYNKPSIPLILQHEIASCVNGQEVLKAKVIEKHRLQREYLDTREVGVQALRAMRENGWETCMILAHEDHAKSCVAVMQRLGVTVIGTITDDAYDPKSTQLWTKYRFLFVLANAYAMYKYRKKDWI